MALLIGVLLVAAGFWGGATLQKRSGGSGSGNASLASAFAARLRGAGATGATGATGAAGDGRGRRGRVRRVRRLERGGGRDGLGRGRLDAVRAEFHRLAREGDARAFDDDHAQRQGPRKRAPARRYGRSSRARRAGTAMSPPRRSRRRPPVSRRAAAASAGAASAAPAGERRVVDRVTSRPAAVLNRRLVSSVTLAQV